MTPIYSTGVHAIIENVSRRGFLKGVLATGGLVIAAEFIPARAALAAYATGAEKCLTASGPTRTFSSRSRPTGS